MTFLLIAFGIALLSGMGVGSGGLLVIYLTLLEDTPQLTAQGINLLFFLFASAASLLIHLARRKIFGGAVFVLSVCGVVGALLGSAVAAQISPALLGKLFGGSRVITGIYSLAREKKGSRAAKPQKRGKNEP